MRPIDADALLKKAHYRETGDLNGEEVLFPSDVEAAPTIDAEPVRHGHWEGDTCTSCNLPWNYNMTQDADDWGYFSPMPDYCPNCGAKMDEVSE